MNYQNYIKKFDLPKDFKAPTKLEYEDLIAKPLTRDDLKEDLNAVNSSMEIIRETRGGSWPEEELSEDFNLLDLAWHEREFRDSESFAYVVYTSENVYVGCFYIYPMGARTTLTENLLQFDADISWWVSASAHEKGYYEKLYSAIKGWESEFPFTEIYYSNADIPMLEE